MALRTRAISLAPKYWEILMENPMVTPMISAIIRNKIGKLAPTAARADLPMARPTMTLSMTL